MEVPPGQRPGLKSTVTAFSREEVESNRRRSSGPQEYEPDSAWSGGQPAEEGEAGVRRPRLGGWGRNVAKAMQVNPGDLPIEGDGGRSQSPHSSDEAPVMGVERRQGREVDA